MSQHYHHFSAFERNVLQQQLNFGGSQTQIAFGLVDPAQRFRVKLGATPLQHHKIPDQA